MSGELAKIVFFGLIVFIAVSVLTLPLLRYVAIGWPVKRKDIMEGLDADARLAYFQMFNRNSAPSDANAASAEFERLYSKSYGRRFFLLPGLLMLLSAIVAVALVTLTVLHAQGFLENPLFSVPATGVAAITGAYMWVVNDCISRSRRLDFSPADVNWNTLRLIIAVPMGYAFAAVVAESVGPFIAFAVGAFPLSTLTSILRRLANRNLGLEGTAEEVSDDVIKLQGVNREIVERLSNEDVTTISQMAYCDPVQLIMRSNLSFNFVTDCMNQALVWLYLEDDLDKLRPLGVRGAADIKRLVDAYDNAGNPQHDLATAAFSKIADAIKQDPTTLQITFRQIAEDPYTIFLDRVWT